MRGDFVNKKKQTEGLFHLKNYSGIYEQGNYTDILEAANKDPTPEEALNLFRGYFRFCEANPLEVTDTAAFRGDLNEDVVQRVRPFTLRGMCAFTGISIYRFKVWREGAGDLAVICQWAEGIIEDQKFAGAAVGMFNASVIMKDLSGDKIKPGEEGDENTVPQGSDELKAVAKSLRDKL